MKRRKLIALIGGAVTWSALGHAQRSDRIRRVGALMNLASDDPESQVRQAAFIDRLQQLGWADGRNVQVDYRWAEADAERFRAYATELLTSTPDVIIAYASPAVAALQRAGGTVPIVFMSVIDPVGAGFVESLAQPGANITGFTLFEYSISAKWLELLKQIAPSVTRAAVFRDPTIAAGIGQFAAIQTVAPSLGIDLRSANVRDPAEIERAFSNFGRLPNGGLIVTASPLATTHRDLIISLAARHRLPTIYPFRYYVAGGGLLAYGPNQIEQMQSAAGYVDRILKGARPADLPVQAPTKYQLIINLKTAKALGLTAPPSLLARADEVIE